jgi:hypothetical protein
MKNWGGTNELVYCISYKRGARSVTFSIHGTDYGALPFFPYYNIATPHLEGITIHLLEKFETALNHHLCSASEVKLKTDQVNFTLISNK